MPVRDRAASIVRTIVRGLRSSAAILLYHRVTELASDPQWLTVPPRLFEEQMDLLHRTCNPMHLGAIHRRLHEGTLPRRAVAVTFDDGYADNYYQAKPILERFDIPATIFVTTGHIGSRHEFWWDELDRIFLGTHPLPQALELEVCGRLMRWELDSPFLGEPRNNWSSWNVASPENPTRRHFVYRQLAAMFRHIDVRTRTVLLNELRNWAGIDDQRRDTHRSMTSDEIASLAHGGLISVASHTVTHTRLSGQPLSEQRWELATSKQLLEDVIGRRIDEFSYPYGQPDDYGSDTRALLRECGYQIACANIPSLVLSRTDQLQFPRILIRDWPMDRFHDVLQSWVGRL